MVTYPNGQVPASKRSAIDTHGRTLLSISAQAWLWVADEVQRRYGWTPEPSSGWTAYRTLAEQDSIFRRNYTPVYAESAKWDQRYYQGRNWWRKKGRTVNAATPGHSNHGWGLAVDVSQLQSFTSTRYKQFKDVATEAGYSNTQGAAINEFWHWVHDGVTAPPKPAPPVPTPPNPEDHPMTVGDTTKVSYPSGKEQPIGTVIAGSGKTAWTTLDFDVDAADEVYTVAKDSDFPRGGHLDVKFLLKGVPVGATVQARVYRVQTDANGSVTPKTSPTPYEFIEQIGTDGNTAVDFGQTFGRVNPTAPSESVRWRIEAQVIVAKGSTAKPGLVSARVIPTIY